MTNFTGYDDVTTTFESGKAIVFRAIKSSDKNPVLIKLIRDEYPTVNDIAILKNEFEILKKLKNEIGVIEVVDFIEENSKYGIVMKDFGQITLAEWAKTHKITIDEFFDIALKLCVALSTLIQHHIVHKDINPNNIIIDPETLEIKLINFSIASQLEEENQEITTPDKIEGTLSYISPEQTGRMNRPIDYRSDFYSLGVTFYGLLANKLPFDSVDLDDLVYCHIAQPAPKLINQTTAIPEIISNIIEKLMAKNPDDRYQSIEGLIYDITEAQIAWKNNGKIENFDIGKKDYSSRFHISHNLYGREKEISVLTSAYKKILSGKSNLLTVSGYSGIGKTALVMELQKLLVENDSQFVSGKSERLQKGTPLFAIAQCINMLVHKLLIEPEEKLAVWRNKLLESVGRNGKIITNLVSDLKLIIGEQPDLNKLDTKESLFRFTTTIKNFISCFATKENPLVIFIDDMQWADALSIQLIEEMMMDPHSEYILLILAYRSNEVTSNHPLLMMLNNLKKENIEYDNIAVNPLTLEDVAHLINGSFKVEHVNELSKIVYDKTLGNPFFINEVLKALYHNKILSFSSAQKIWTLKLNELESLEISANVADIISHKIKKLSIQAQDIAKVSACLGNTFDSASLYDICELSNEEISNGLWELLKNQIIIPLNKEYKNIQFLQKSSSKNIRYKFLHDRIQQSAYDLLSDDEKMTIHHKIGLYLIKEFRITANSEINSNVINMLDHMLKCVTIIRDENEKQLLSEILLSAGIAAKLSVSHAQSITYFETAINLLSPLDWNKNHTILFSIYRELAESEYFVENFKMAESYFRIALDHSPSNYDKAAIYQLILEMNLVNKDGEKAIIAGLKSLHYLGVDLPRRVGKFRVLSALIYFLWRVNTINIKSLEKLPLMKNKEMDLATRTINKMIEPSYRHDINLMVVLILKIINITIDNGINDLAPMVFDYAASLAYKLFPKSKLSFRFLDLSNEISKRVVESYYPRRMLSDLTIHLPRTESMETIIKGLRECSRLCLEQNDYIFYSYALEGIPLYLFHYGQRLEEAYADALVSEEFIQQFKKSYHAQTSYYLTINLEYLLGKIQLTEEDIHQRVANFQKGDIRSEAWCYTDAGYMLYWMDNKKRSLDYLIQFYQIFRIEKYAEYGFFMPCLYFILSLNDVYDTLDAKLKKQCLKYSKEILNQMKFWNEDNPLLYSSAYNLYQAEYDKLTNKISTIEHYYNAAIDSAVKANTPLFAALANERLGRYYLNQQKLMFAKSYIQESYYHYSIWGSKLKLERLEKEFPHWIKSMKSSSTAMIESNMIDYLSIYKATQSISSEIETNKLLTEMITIVIKNSAAQRCLFLKIIDDKPWIIAEGHAHDNNINISISPSTLESRADLSISIFNYVWRTNETLLFDNVSLDEKFNKDAYIAKNLPKSLLCLPIMYHGSVSGYLYLENNLSECAFTHAHLETIRMLATQAAISLENSSIYEATARFVPNQFIDLLKKKNITEVNLGDHVEQEMTILFSDIRNFTTISEQMRPDENFDYINNYLAYMEPIITKHGGFIDKYIGDAIMALFSSPDSALKASIEMQDEIIKINQADNNHLPLSIGIGINTGKLMLGILGGKTRIDSSVIGDAVNTASRVESLTKEYNAKILITEETKKRLVNDTQKMIKRGDVYVKGKTEPVGIWEIIH